MIDLDQLTCGKCGELYTTPACKPDEVRWTAGFCETCRPPGPTRVTIEMGVFTSAPPPTELETRAIEEELARRARKIQDQMFDKLLFGRPPQG